MSLWERQFIVDARWPQERGKYSRKQRRRLCTRNGDLLRRHFNETQRDAKPGKHSTRETEGFEKASREPTTRAWMIVGCALRIRQHNMARQGKSVFKCQRVAISAKENLRKFFRLYKELVMCFVEAALLCTSLKCFCDAKFSEKAVSYDWKLIVPWKFSLVCVQVQIAHICSRPRLRFDNKLEHINFTTFAFFRQNGSCWSTYEQSLSIISLSEKSISTELTSQKQNGEWRFFNLSVMISREGGSPEILQKTLYWQ